MAETANRSRGSGRRVRGAFVPDVRCGYRNPTLSSILATQMPCRTDVSLVESYPGIDIPDGECLVRMRLNIKNTSSQTYTMFLQDFQIQWGEGDNDYGTCLNAVDDTMMPYAYELTPGQERSDWLMAEIPEGSTSCTIAYQEYKTDGSKGDAYFVEAAL